MKKINLFIFELFLFFTLINSLNDSPKDETIKYLEFPFKRNLTLNDSMTPKQFFEASLYNQIYIDLVVGSNKQKIPFYLYLQQYPLVLQSSNANKGEVKGIYDELKSKTYKAIEEESDFQNEDLVIGMLSTDNFYFDSKPLNIHFFLSIENYGDSHITEGGKIGFKFWQRDEQPLKFKNLTFVTSLKNLDIISGYEFSFIYDSNNLSEDTGVLYIGALLHDINKNKYNENYYYSTYSNLNLNGLWGYTIDKISLGNESFDQAKDGFFYPEFGFIVGTFNFFEKLNRTGNWFEYFNINKKCHTTKIKISDMDANGLMRFIYEFTGYFCDKDVDVNNIINTNITFFSRDFGNILSLNNEDLWMERNDYKYFMILQTLNTENVWIFGKPFFKKYHLVFNQDKKTIGFYTNINYTVVDNNVPEESKESEEPINKNILLFCIIGGMAILVVVLTFLLIRFYIYYPRKKRANELIDDNFDYKEGDKNENIIIPPEGDNNTENKI